MTCYVPTKHREIVSDTIKIIPNYVPIPQTNIDDYIRAQFDTIIQLLKNKKQHMALRHHPNSAIAKIAIAKSIHNNDHNILHPSPQSREIVSVTKPTSEGVG